MAFCARIWGNMTRRDPTRDPLPKTLPEIEREITYWTSRLGEGEAGSNWEHWVDARLRKLQRSKEELLAKEQESHSRSKPPGHTGLVFLSCGQFTQEERLLGNRVKELLETHTGLEVYFAENQSSFRGLTDHILRALNRSVAFVGIMHHRGEVRALTETFVRASVWIEQEIAIASFIEHILGRKIEVLFYIQRGIKREGMRDKLLLNAIEFDADSEVLEHLKKSLDRWKSLEASLRPADHTFDSTYAERRDRARSDVFILRRLVPPESPPYRSETYFWVFLSPTKELQISLDEAVKQRLGMLVTKYFLGHGKLPQLEGVKREWSDGTYYTDLGLIIPPHDQERHWRLYSSGELAFVTQVRWDVPGQGALWSLFDSAMDLVYLVDAAESLWKELGYWGQVRLAAELKVSGLDLDQAAGVFPSLFYAFVTGIRLLFRLPALTLATQPRTYAFAETEFDSASVSRRQGQHVGKALNQVLRGLGHSANLEELCQTIQIWSDVGRVSE